MKLDLTLYGPVETEIRVGTTLCSLHSGENVCSFVQSHSGTQAVSEDIETAFRERERERPNAKELGFFGMSGLSTRREA